MDQSYSHDRILPASMVDRSPPALLTRRTLLRRAGGATIGLAALNLNPVPQTVSAIGAAPIAPVSSYPATVASDWFTLALRLVRDTPGFSPPVASRAFAYLGVALYEALVPGIPAARSLAGQLNDLTPPPAPNDHACHWPTVTNSLLATLTRRLFPTAPAPLQTTIDALEATHATAFAATLPPGLHQRSVKRGISVAAHIFAWSTTDGGHAGYLTNFPASYSPPTGPGHWIPTPPGFQPALQPFWGANRPFVLASGAEVDPGPPTPYSEDPDSAAYAEALEVYDTVNSLTPEQLEIAHFWSDDPGITATPPGHSISIMTQTIQLMHADLALAAEAYARVGMAVADAFIACWYTKYRYNLLRPITYIQQFIDSGWGNPLPLVTPPFPEYTSGHSVQCGAMAQVLFDLFGDFAFTDHTHAGRGLAPRSFTSCAQIARETAISRLYGGIHFRPAIEIGLEQGKAVGRKVSALAFR